ncbi:MAG: hypothetical protein ABSD59_03290 [Terracidiphilus sp.]|jgi:hypothetical protein
MAVLSVDLACRRWSDLGVVVLSRAPSLLAAPPITCEILPFDPADFDAAHDPGFIDPEVLAGRLNHLCAVRDIRILMLDGPQAWKSSANGLLHARVSERQLNTAAKTGLPGMVKPSTYRLFAEFCMDVYDALSRRGWRRLETRPQPVTSDLAVAPVERVLVESYPHAAWKSLGLKPLAAKRRARVSDLAEAYGALRAVIPFTTNRPPNHDQLQAIVAGLPGLALEEHNPSAMRIVGNPPRREQGHWREGFIVLPLPPRTASSVRWLD